MFVNIVSGVTGFLNAPLTSDLSIGKLMLLFVLILIVGFFVMDTLHHFNKII